MTIQCAKRIWAVKKEEQRLLFLYENLYEKNYFLYNIKGEKRIIEEKPAKSKLIKTIKNGYGKQEKKAWVLRLVMVL